MPTPLGVKKPLGLARVNLEVAGQRVETNGTVIGDAPHLHPRPFGSEKRMGRGGAGRSQAVGAPL